jgi:hypothetical protein
VKPSNITSLPHCLPLAGRGSMGSPVLRPTA